MNYTIRHLQAMTTVARLGSYSHAAKQLHMSRPSLSQAIKELEQQLGFDVFTRTTRSVTLTDKGRVFLPHAETVIAEYRNSLWVAQNVARRANGVLRVACGQLMAGTFLADILVEFSAHNPLVDVRVLDVPLARTIETVLSGDADIGFAAERPLPDTLVGSVLFSAPFGCVCAAEHPFAARAEVTWKEVANEHVISPSPTMLPVLMHDIGYSAQLRAFMSTSHLLTSLALVSRNLGVMPCLDYVRPLLPTYGLRLVPVVDPVVARHIVVVTRAPRELSPAAQAFCAAAEKIVVMGVDAPRRARPASAASVDGPDDGA